MPAKIIFNRFPSVAPNTAQRQSNYAAQNYDLFPQPVCCLACVLSPRHMLRSIGSVHFFIIVIGLHGVSGMFSPLLA